MMDTALYNKDLLVMVLHIIQQEMPVNTDIQPLLFQQIMGITDRWQAPQTRATMFNLVFHECG